MPVGRPSFLYVYLVSYSVLSKIRSSERVVVQLAMLITSAVPVNGWHMPESGSRMEQGSDDHVQWWLVFCLSCVALLMSGCTANVRRIALVSTSQLMMVGCGVVPVVQWLVGMLSDPQRYDKASQADGFRKASPVFCPSFKVVRVGKRPRHGPCNPKAVNGRWTCRQLVYLLRALMVGTVATSSTCLFFSSYVQFSAV